MVQPHAFVAQSTHPKKRQGERIGEPEIHLQPCCVTDTNKSAIKRAFDFNFILVLQWLLKHAVLKLCLRTEHPQRQYGDQSQPIRAGILRRRDVLELFHGVEHPRPPVQRLLPPHCPGMDAADRAGRFDAVRDRQMQEEFAQVRSRCI